ncbi:MAG TPA: hypothetical protein ENG70_00070 [Candidatus Cloacimonetes bacterium]|nr:hypothetical protein [Candidatus Cloacimonadota bacterium]HEX37251.1 hypothetical protein [Candidatus Cloacimonadota bacterium]
MKCLDKNILIDHVNNDLSARKKKQVITHLSTCEKCRIELEKWRKVLQTTEQFVAGDIAAHSVPPHAHITRRFEKLSKKEKILQPEQGRWLHAWARPIIVTACAIVATLMLYFFSQRTSPITPADYYIIDNGFNTEAVTLNEDTIEQLESYYLREIYENDELRNDILYGDWQEYDDQLEYLDENEMENLLQELYGEKIT